MRINIKKYIITFFILIVTFVMGAEQKIPNIMVLENPTKEVTTVEGLKNRESAEMNIEVKKRAIEKIEGIRTKDGIEFVLPEGSFLENEEIRVVNSLVDMPIETSKNSRRKRSLSTSTVIPSTVVNIGDKKIIKVAKEVVDNAKYILKMDRNTNSINSVYAISTYPEINIGEVELQVDNRLMDKGVWFRGNGGVSTAIDGDRTYYPELINIDGNFSNLKSIMISNALGMDGRVFRDIIGGYKIFTPKSGGSSWLDEGAMPFDFNLIELKDRVIISNYNSNDLKWRNNNFVLIGNSEQFAGNIKEVYLGEPAIEGVATLDITKLIVSDWTRWDIPGGSGELASTAGISSTMKFTSGKLFNWKSAVKSGNRHVVTRLKVTNKGVVDDLVISVNDKTQTTKFDNNSIGIESSGGIFVTKKTESVAPETYEIEAYYKDVLLGKLNLTVTNGRASDIGTINYKIDNRLRKHMESKNLKWANGIGGIGENRNDWNNATDLETRQYPLLSQKVGSLSLTTPIKSWNQADGRTILRQTWGNKTIFSEKNNSSVDGMALAYTEVNPATPIGTESSFSKFSYFSFANLSKGQSESDTVMYIGANNKYYKFNINVTVGNEEEIVGNGKIDLTKLKINNFYTFNKFETGIVSSLEDSNTKLELASGSLLPQTQGYSNQNIATRLQIAINGGSATTVNGLDYTSNSKYDISFDSTTGNLRIKKKDDRTTYTDSVVIKYFYKNIELGTFTLEIKNEKTIFEIIGDDIIDFGAIIQGQSMKKEGNIVIKNLDSRRILDVTLNDKKPIRVLKKNDSSVELPIVGDVTLLKNDTEVPIRVNLTANPQINQPIGDYEGELNLYIYIE